LTNEIVFHKEAVFNAAKKTNKKREGINDQI